MGDKNFNTKGVVKMGTGVFRDDKKKDRTEICPRESQGGWGVG